MLVLIAGQGRLPASLVEALRAGGSEFRVAELEGFPAEVPSVGDVIHFRIEQLGSFLAQLGEIGATEVCFAGAIRRPPLDPTAIDPATMPLVPRMMAALQSGDDAALRTVIAFFEEAGLRVRAAHEVLPALLPEPGIPTAAEPGKAVERDAACGAEVVAALGAADIGQACVVHKGQVLVSEGSFGTDWMLASLAKRPDGRGGTLYKAPKPDQDRRIDLPAIGPETVRGAAAAGLDGIVIEAGGVMVLDFGETVRLADEAGLFLWIRQP